MNKQSNLPILTPSHHLHVWSFKRLFYCQFKNKSTDQKQVLTQTSWNEYKPTLEYGFVVCYVKCVKYLEMYTCTYVEKNLEVRRNRIKPIMHCW